MIIAENGKSDYRIVIGENASPSEKHGASELQMFLKEISGAEIPVVTDKTSAGDHEIILGDNDRLSNLGVNIDWNKLGDEGFTIRTVDGKLIIAGGKLRGTMYGVYTFLEDYLNCKWFNSKVSRIPKKDRIELKRISNTQVPALEYREPFYTDAFDGDWSARNKMNSTTSRLTKDHGGKVTYSHFVHTFDSILSPSDHFADHPEYFSEIDGKRVSEHTQLCLTNADVLKTAIEKVRQWIKESPEANIFSVSQNDWHNWCQCPKCKAIDDAEESHSGTMLWFVNQVAEAIEKDYPDKAIDTLAYQYTRKPPKNIKPRKNVIVRLCSIECCFSHSLDECEVNASFKTDIQGWSKMSDRLYIWDYVTDFSHYILPFPNLYVLKPNIQFFVNHGVKGIFEEGNYSGGGKGELAELRAYVLAKLLWNPDYDTDTAIDEFLEGYYGKASSPIREYINILHGNVMCDKSLHMNIWANPKIGYLSEDNMFLAEELFDKAEKLADNDEILARVLVARLPIQYVRISNLPADDPKREEIIGKFFDVTDKEGITSINEGMSMDAYKKALGKT
jgi:hypothetical protein